MEVLAKVKVFFIFSLIVVADEGTSIPGGAGKCAWEWKKRRVAKPTTPPLMQRQSRRLRISVG